MDAFKNFAYSTVTVAPAPATSGETMTVAAASRFPAPPFNAVVWPAGTLPRATNAEIIRVTGVADNVLTFSRAQEDTTAKEIEANWNIAQNITKKTLDDIATAIADAGNFDPNNPTLIGYTLTGSRRVVTTTITGTDVDITKPETVKVVTEDVTLALIGTPSEGYEFRLTLKAASAACVVTLPPVYSSARQGTITSVSVPANGTLRLVFLYDGARWEIIGDPPRVEGSGAFLATNMPVEPLTDATAIGPKTDSLAAGTTVDAFDTVYLGSGGKWLLTDADAEATSKGLLAMALESKNNTQAMLVALPGSIIRNDGWNWATVGGELYLDTGTAGGLTETPPGGNTNVVRIVAWVLSDDCIFFNPEASWTKVAT